MLWKIKESVIESIQKASKNVYPSEFIALLGGNKAEKLIDHLIVLPSIFGTNFSSIRLDLMPFDQSLVGSVHSHPGPYASPSKQDIVFFRKIGLAHLIIGFPFNFNSFNLYDFNGKKLDYKIIS